MLRLSLCLILLPCYDSSVLSGWVESPGYPRGYQPFASMNWSRCAPPGHTLSLSLTHLDLEDSHHCENDALEIFADGNELDLLCGQIPFEELDSSINPSLVSAVGGCLSLAFRSDYSNPRRHTGFRGFYTLQDYDECDDDPDTSCSQFCYNHIGGYVCSCRPGYYLDSDGHTCTVSCSEDLSGSMRGLISSPSWPALYAENAHCSYSLAVEESLQLVLEFTGHFDVEQTPEGQCVDLLTIPTSKGIKRFCGQVPPPTVVTGLHRVNILFSSDGHGSNTGFTIQYRASAKTCPGFVTSNATLDPQLPPYNHGNKVTVTCDLGMDLGNSLHGSPQYDSETAYESICQRTGVWSPVFRCEPVDCGVPDIPEGSILQMTEADPTTLYGHSVRLECTSKYYTLEGDDTYICNASGSWVSPVTGRDGWPKYTEVCGQTEKDILTAGRILGGSAVKLGQVPWQILIHNKGGASLISDRWVLTAAHVVDTSVEAVEHLRLYGGLIDQKKRGEVVDLTVSKIIIHPDYVKNIDSLRTDYNNDIALIRLTDRVRLGPNLLPVCLPTAEEELEEEQLGSVSGWGATESKRGTIKDRSQVLLQTTVAVKPVSQCEDTPSIEGKHPAFTENMFCAGNEGMDSCKGDSGGPFVVPLLGSGDRNKPYRVMGLVSWGNRCVERQYKGYYTKVSKYVAWIKETIEREEKEEE